MHSVMMQWQLIPNSCTFSRTYSVNLFGGGLNLRKTKKKSYMSLALTSSLEQMFLERGNKRTNCGRLKGYSLSHDEVVLDIK